MSNSTNTTIRTSTQNLTGLEGQIVARSFIAEYVVLSYLVSYIGAWTTLELINRRTGMRGSYNWFLLAGSSFTMGGIAIWSMHFIGNRAIVLGDGQPQLQIVYSAGFTVISFFLPIIVLFLAFFAVGSNETTNVTRVVLGGALTGFGACGMHYLGQAGISNYDCVYPIPFVVGADIIAVVASIVALFIFFLFRLSWDTAWWRRPVCAIVLASAVSGMHWLASVGTQYRLKKADPSLVNSFSENSVITAVIVLSIGACIILFISTLLAQRRIAKLSKRAQQVVLAAAVFNCEDKILVTPEGHLPNKKITDSWVERSLDDGFSVSHPIFLWMFRAARNWNGVSNLLQGMRRHVYRAGLKRRLGSKFEANLLNSHGSPIEDYSLVFRELFCVAAGDLADDMKQPLDKMGVLYDEITLTGQGTIKGKKNGAAADLDIEGLSSGKGQLLFLVRTVNRREAERLQGAGFRFVTLSNMIPLMATTLQVSPRSLTRRFEMLREYAADDPMLDPGVHLAIFAIRASLGAGRHGFDILARKDAKNQLPTMQLPFDRLEAWQIDYLRAMDSLNVTAVMKTLNRASQSNNPSQREQEFAKHLLKTVEALKEESEDPIFYDAMLIADPIRAPCRGASEDSPPGVATLITFRIIVPIHSRAPGRKLTFIPLNFFRMRQHVYKNSRDHEVFARKIYQEFAPALELEDLATNVASTFASDTFGNGQSSQDERGNVERSGSRRSTPAPSDPKTKRRGSKGKRWGLGGENSSETNLVDANSHDDDQAIVDVGNPARMTASISLRQSKSPGGGQNAQSGGVKMSKEEEEAQTYIDEMFAITIAKRN